MRRLTIYTARYASAYSHAARRPSSKSAAISAVNGMMIAIDRDVFVSR